MLQAELRSFDRLSNKEDSVLDLFNIIKDAELDMGFMSGRGLGAVLLAAVALAVALAVVWRTKSGEVLVVALTEIARSCLAKK